MTVLLSLLDKCSILQSNSVFVKIFFAILLITSVFAYEVLVSVTALEKESLTLLDISSEGQSEKESSDSSEEDKKLEYLSNDFEGLNSINEQVQGSLINLRILAQSNKIDIQSPPPESFMS